MTDSAETSEARLRRLEDRNELHDLVVRYCVAVDDKDFEALAELLADDVLWEARRSVTGREALLADLRTSLADIGASVHTPDFQQVHFIDDDAASGLVGSHVELALRGQAVFGVVRYHDRYRRDCGRRQFSARRQQVLYLAPWAAVPQALIRAPAP